MNYFVSRDSPNILNILKVPLAILLISNEESDFEKTGL